MSAVFRAIGHIETGSAESPLPRCWKTSATSTMKTPRVFSRPAGRVRQRRALKVSKSASISCYLLTNTCMCVYTYIYIMYRYRKILQYIYMYIYYMFTIINETSAKSVSLSVKHGSKILSYWGAGHDAVWGDPLFRVLSNSLSRRRRVTPRWRALLKVTWFTYLFKAPKKDWRRKMIDSYGGFQKWGYPQIIPF